MTRKELLCNYPNLPYVPPYLPDQEKEEVVLDESTKTLVKTSTRQSVDVKESFKKFKASDYSLQNLAYVGAVDQLKPSVLPSDTFDAIDKVDFDSLESALNVNTSVENVSSDPPQNS